MSRPWSCSPADPEISHHHLVVRRRQWNICPVLACRIRVAHGVLQMLVVHRTRIEQSHQCWWSHGLIWALYIAIRLSAATILAGPTESLIGMLCFRHLYAYYDLCHRPNHYHGDSARDSDWYALFDSRYVLPPSAAHQSFSSHLRGNPWWFWLLNDKTVQMTGVTPRCPGLVVGD